MVCRHVVVIVIASLLISGPANGQLITPNIGTTDPTQLKPASFFGEGGIQSVADVGAENPLAQFFLRSLVVPRAHLYVVGNISGGLEASDEEIGLASLVFRNSGNSAFIGHLEYFLPALTNRTIADRAITVPLYVEYAFQRYTVQFDDQTSAAFQTATWDVGARLYFATGSESNDRFRVSVTPHWQVVQVADRTHEAYRAVLGTESGTEFHGPGVQFVVQLNDFAFEFGWQNALAIGASPTEKGGLYVVRVSAAGTLFEIGDGLLSR